MGEFITIFGFGFTVLLCLGYLFNYLIGAILGVIYALLTYAYYHFDLPEGYFIALLVILVLCIAVARIKLWYDNK